MAKEKIRMCWTAYIIDKRPSKTGGHDILDSITKSDEKLALSCARRWAEYKGYKDFYIETDDTTDKFE